jgi:hypothetical protein
MGVVIPTLYNDYGDYGNYDDSLRFVVIIIKISPQSFSITVITVMVITLLLYI